MGYACVGAGHILTAVLMGLWRPQSLVELLYVQR